MPRRRDDEDDDDDYLPRKRRDREAGGGFPVPLGVGLGIGAVVVVGLLVLFMARSRETRRAEAATEAARAEIGRAAVRGLVPLPGGPAWPRMIGTWERVPRGRDDADYPFRFEFRDDMTGSMTRVNFDGNLLRREVTIMVMSDGNDTARLALDLSPTERYGYAFTVKPDGTMVLNEERGPGLVFTREE